MTVETKKTLEQVGLIPVLRASSVELGHALVEAMMAGGVTMVEVTMTVPNALTLLRELKQKHGDRLLLGSGTVTGNNIDARRPSLRHDGDPDPRGDASRQAARARLR